MGMHPYGNEQCMLNYSLNDTDSTVHTVLFMSLQYFMYAKLITTHIHVSLTKIIIH